MPDNFVALHGNGNYPSPTAPAMPTLNVFEVLCLYTDAESLGVCAFMFTLTACSQYRGPPYPLSGGGGVGGGRGAGSGNVKLGSGRSPFLARLQTPLVSQKRSKSLSPSHHAGRLSPFSQTINSNTWSTFFSDESALPLDPLLPQVCLQKMLDIPQR